MTDLKPCPFCGGKAREYRYQYGENGKLITRCCIECSECKAKLPTRYCSTNYSESVMNWNRRAND
jgi:Lar family restriction alleviation protein